MIVDQDYHKETQKTMSYLSESIFEKEPELQERVWKIIDAPSLGLLILAAWELGREIAVRIVEETLNERGRAPENQSRRCEKCGRALESKGLKRRTMVTLIGQVKWRRRVRRCPQGCKIGQVAPSDEALGLGPFQKTSEEVKWLGCALAVFVPYETSGQLLAMLSGVKVSGKAIWGWVQASGQRAQAELSAELANLEVGVLPELEASDTASQALKLAIGADGVMVPFRPEGGQPTGSTRWREVKVGILARLGKRSQGTTKLVQRRLVAVLGSVDRFGPLLWLEAQRQGLSQAPAVVWLSDGGSGFWGLYHTYFAPHAQGILDFYHAAQNLWLGAKAAFDGRSAKAKLWFALNRRRLRQGQSDLVFDDIEAALALDDLPPAAQQTLTNLFLYLDQHRDHIDYAHFETLGLPLGSGMVESACKWLIQQRFKGVGMRWSEDGFNHLLFLRLAWVNGRFEHLFSL